MPRLKRYFLPGQVCHITHRCHDRRFLLRCERDRRRYRWWLWEGLQRYCASLLGFSLTSNHVHLLLYAHDGQCISNLVQLVHSRVAQEWVRRKEGSGAFWADRFHATLVESGEHLWRCLLYIELNMVRAGAVDHPGAWRWCSYSELRSGRRRHQVLDVSVLLKLLSCPDLETFKRNQDAGIELMLLEDKRKRNPIWTECAAVGSEPFVRRSASTMKHRQEWQYQLDDSDGNHTWSVRESFGDYNKGF